MVDYNVMTRGVMMVNGMRGNGVMGFVGAWDNLTFFLLFAF